MTASCGWCGTKVSVSAIASGVILSGEIFVLLEKTDDDDLLGFGCGGGCSEEGECMSEDWRVGKKFFGCQYENEQGQSSAPTTMSGR